MLGRIFLSIPPVSSPPPTQKTYLTVAETVKVPCRPSLSNKNFRGKEPGFAPTVLLIRSVWHRKAYARRRTRRSIFCSPSLVPLFFIIILGKFLALLISEQDKKKSSQCACAHLYFQFKYFQKAFCDFSEDIFCDVGMVDIC